MADENQDANIPEGSSPEADRGSTATDTTPPAEEAELTTAEVAQRAYEESVRNAPSGEGDEAQTSESLSDPNRRDTKPPAKADQTAQPATGTPPATPALTPPTPEEVPFHDHPRWKQVLAERDSYKTQFEQASPTLQAWQFHQQFMQQYGISQEDVARAMDILAMQRTDPARAREMLAPIWQQLSQFDPEAIPPDIQKMVDENEMTPVAAKMMAQMRAEINRSRAGTVFNEQNQQRSLAQSINNSINEWRDTKMKTDPDFFPKKQGDSDGLFEQTAKGFAYAQSMKFARNATEAVQNLEQAYKEAKGFIARLVAPKVNTPVRPSSSKAVSAPKKKPEDETIDDAVMAVARQHGIPWNGRQPFETD